MSIFAYINWFFCVSTLLLLLVILVKYKYLYLKPSIFFILFFHLRIQWGSAIATTDIENFLPHPIDFFLLVNLFPFISLILSLYIKSGKYKLIWSRIATKENFYRVSNKFVTTMFLITSFIMIIYLLFVPLNQTGLWAIFFDPANSHIVRETSLKLLDVTWVKYLYTFLLTAFAPILFSYTFFVLYKRKFILGKCYTLYYIFICIFLLISVSLTGARAPAAMLLMIGLLMIYINKGIPVKVLPIIIMLIVIFTVPTILSIIREGKILTLNDFVFYMRTAILWRVFEIPVLVGMQHIHYTQLNGFIGFAGIHKLAYFLNLEYINLPNIIYLTYSGWDLPSGTANTCFIFTYYSCFGLISLPISIVSLLLLDLSVETLMLIKNRILLLTGISAFLLSSISFLETDFTTGLLTGGFLIIILVFFIASKLIYDN